MSRYGSTKHKKLMALEVQQKDNEAGGVIGVRTITNAQQIYSILSAVQKARTPITIRFEGIDKYYTSIILKTDADDYSMIIDELAPEEGHELALQHASFSIRGSHGGVSLFFKPNMINGSGVENGIAFYRIPMPKEMIYQQRRNSYRALVPRALNVQCSLTSNSRPGTLSGRLHDISIGGCRVNFTGEVEPMLIRGDVFENVEITLPEGDKINYPLVLKHSSYSREINETSCGFEFEGIDKTGQRIVDRFVYFLQREARRLETK